MAEIVLYMFPGACSRVTMTALEEVGVTYEDRTVNLRADVQHSPAYLAVNRKGKVPMLSLDGETLTENAAILAFLHGRHPDAALLPRGDGPLAGATALSDLIWCSSTLHPEVRQIRAPHKLTTGDPASVQADGMQKFAKECGYISKRVSSEGWWYGADWSIVDTYLYWAYSTAAKGGFPTSDYPDLVAHAERVRARPSFQRALAREVAAVRREQLPIDAESL